jgi:hypothetical protein
MKKLIIIFLAELIALSGLYALNVGVHLQTTSKILNQENDLGYEVVLTEATTTLQKNLAGDLGVAGKIGIGFGASATLDGEGFFIGGESEIFNFSATACLTYIPLLGNNIYLYSDAHVTWSSMTWQTGNASTWDRTAFHSLWAGGSVGILSRSHKGLQSSRFSIYLSYDVPLLSFRAERQKEKGKMVSETIGRISATGKSLALSAGVTIPI